VTASVDASCSGRRAACAAVLAVDSRIIAERSRGLPEVDGYALAAEIAAVALAAEMVDAHCPGERVVVEVDNPQVPRVLLDGVEPPQAHRIPKTLRDRAAAFCRSGAVTVRVLARNASPGLRRADRLASRRLWGR
jgi:hypothetical protein